jgi:hypothetical protein
MQVNLKVLNFAFFLRLYKLNLLFMGEMVISIQYDVNNMRVTSWGSVNTYTEI